MNQNIKIISPKLWVVNFSYVKMGYIQELNFQVTNESDAMCLMNDGRWILNSDIPEYEQCIPYIQAIMKLPIDKLKTNAGFVSSIRGICPGAKKASDEQIEQIIHQYNLESIKTIFQNMCEVEIKRRQLQKSYIKSNGKPFDIKPLFKNLLGKAGENKWQV